MILLQHLQDAIETGEVLTVIYHGGHAPGTKRKVLPRRLLDDLVYAKDFGETVIKSYKLDRLELGSEDHPAPWLHEVAAKQKFEKVDPVTYFEDWKFQVHRALWPALGVTLREFIHKEKTKAAREAAKARGEDNMAKIAIRYLAHTVATTPVLDFHEGDLFASKENGSFLQVIAIGEYVEAHEISGSQRHAFHVTDTELSEWLRTGGKPSNSRIGKGQSYSEVLRFSIEEQASKGGA